MNKVPETLVRIVADRCDQAFLKLQEWHSKFMTQPAYQMRWGNQAFEAAANYTEYKNLRDVLTNPEFKNTLPNLLKGYQDRVHNAAKFPSFSTSVPANLMDLFTAAAQAEIVEILRPFAEGTAE